MAQQDAYYTDHRARMQGKVSSAGFTGLSEVEVLEYLLFFVIPRIDTKPIAHALLDRFGSFSNVLRATEEELQEIPHVGIKTARFLHAQLLLFNYYSVNSNKLSESFHSAAASIHYCVNLFKGIDTEQFYVLLLDSGLRHIKTILLSEGTVDSVSVSVRRIAQAALRHNAANVILSHNHPSGDCTPSQEDITTTEAVSQALQLLNIQLVDHIVVGHSNACSMAQKQLLH